MHDIVFIAFYKEADKVLILLDAKLAVGAGFQPLLSLRCGPKRAGSVNLPL